MSSSEQRTRGQLYRLLHKLATELVELEEERQRLLREMRCLLDERGIKDSTQIGGES